MVKRVKNTLKQILFLVAKLIPFRVFCLLCDFYARRKRGGGRFGYYLERMMNYLNRVLVTEKLVVEKIPYFSDRFGSRYEIYSYIFERYVREPVDYLEFGVAQGGSMGFALSKLGPVSHLYGFDSFEGLPEDWYYRVKRGEFGNEGEPPPLRAPNLTFVKGWFEESLRPFLVSTKLKPHLILHMDADIYSATIYVFQTMQELLIPGTIVVFDEYWFLKDEFRALKDFILETGKKFKYLAVSDTRAAIQFIP